MRFPIYQEFKGLVPEYAPHKGTIAMFPSRPDIWRNDAKYIREYMIKLVTKISYYETVYFFCKPSLGQLLIDYYKDNENVKVIPAEYDDIWARDIAPAFVKSDQGITCVDWRFNAWGGRKEGAYYPWDKDDFFALFVSNYLGLKSVRSSLVVEGGGIMTDGVGTIFTTRSVLLNRNRNPFKRFYDIEKELLERTSASRVVWLDQGLTFDETDGHIDNLLSFISPTEMCLAWTEDESNPHAKQLTQVYQKLKGMKNLKGEPYTIHLIPLPEEQKRAKREANGLKQSYINPIRRMAGDILPASYLNFYMLNGAVIVPSFGCKTDAEVLKIFKKLFTDREVIQVYSREALLGGGGIHCLLHEVPEFDGEPTVKSVMSRKVEIKQSKIHGKGMFAKEPIKKGEIVYVKGGHILTWKEMYSSGIMNSYLPISDEYVVGARTEAEEELVKLHNNHSCDPNCGMGGEVTFVAMRRIKKGEELTIDYEFIDNEEFDFECNCHSKKCRKTIHRRDRDIMEWIKKRLIHNFFQFFYQYFHDDYFQYFAPYLQEKISKFYQQYYMDNWQETTIQHFVSNLEANKIQKDSK